MNTKRTLPIILLLTVALVFVGCVGEPSPTQEPSPAATTGTPLAATPESNTLPTAEPNTLPTAEPTQVSLFPTLDILVYPTIAETPFPTPDPAASPVPTEEILPPPSGFDRIILIRTGGPQFEDGTTADEVIILNRLDNTISRGDAQGALSEASVTRIAALVDAANFFTVEGIFLGAVPAEPPLPFIYSITVIAGSDERSISAQEGFMSPEIQSLIGSVLSEGQRVPKP